MTTRDHCSSRRSAHAQSGFTLIELMAVVAIIGILAAVAIPSYSAYVDRSKRTAAKTVLVDVASQLERNYTALGCYNKTTVAVCQSQAAGSNYSLPATVSPREGRASHAVTVDFGMSATGQQFRLAATPCGDVGAGCPAGSDAFVDAECGTLTLTEGGERGVTLGGTAYTSATNAALISRCWPR